MPDDNVAEAHSKGQTVESTRDQARKMASLLAEGVAEDASVEVTPERASHKLSTDHGLPDYAGKAVRSDQEPLSFEDEPTPAPASSPTPEATTDQEIVAQVAEEMDLEVTPELLDELADQGIELGIDPTSVPQELRPGFTRLVEAAMTVAGRYQRVDLEAQQLKLERQELSDKFENEPEKILLALAVTKPEAFQQALDVFNKMQQNPEYADMIVRELASEARIADADRRERVNAYQAKKEAGNRIKAECNRQAARLGIDPVVAAKQVAMAITANEGNPIPVTDIKGILEPLAGAGKRPVRQPIATPERQRVVQQAPTTPSGEGVAPEAPVLSEKPTRGSQSKIRAVVANALRKGTASEQ